MLDQFLAEVVVSLFIFTFVVLPQWGCGPYKNAEDVRSVFSLTYRYGVHTGM